MQMFFLFKFFSLWNLSSYLCYDNFIIAEEVSIQLQKTLEKWNYFEQNLERHLSWCREIELDIKTQEPCSSLEEKKERFEFLNEKREQVIKYEEKIEDFVDKGHALVRISTVNHLKTLLTQLSSRYQNIHVLSKETVTKWSNIYKEHKCFEDKVQETNCWLNSIEMCLKSLASSKDTVKSEQLLH